MAAGIFSGAVIANANSAPRVMPPSAVRSAFETRFPNAKVKEWSERKEGQKDTYTATFKENGKKLFAYYDPDGTWEGTGTPLKWSKDLPMAVRQAWRNGDYAAWKIMDIREIKTPGGMLYQLHLNNSLEDHTHDFAIDDECKLIYNSQGQLVTKEMR